MRSEEIEIVQIAFGAPEMNGFAESFVGTLKRECLNHFTIASVEHMNRLCQQYTVFYNTVRPHRALDHRSIEPKEATCPTGYSPEALRSEEWLGGVLRHYHWKSAA